MTAKSKVKAWPEQLKKPILDLIKSGKWEIADTPGVQHHKLRHIPTGRVVIMASTPRCPRVVKNILRDIKHVEAGMPKWGTPKEIDVPIDLSAKTLDYKRNPKEKRNVVRT